VEANLQASAKTDLLSDTVDYVFLNKVIREEMNTPSHLLETVAKRVLNRIFAEDKLVTKATVWISKLNPPIGGDVEMVTIKMTEKRKI
jgi:dihydroneopterin aldolase